MPNTMQNELRIIIVGTSCSGKTTFAGKIARELNITHIELDALHWGQNWCPRPEKEFISLVSKAVEEVSWVADGNYRIVRDIIWKKANILICLNYSFLTILRQAIVRTLIRAITKEELFSGNRESFITSFFSRESILLWVLKTYSRRKRDYPELFKKQEYSHLRIIEFNNRRQADEFFKQL